MDISSLAGISNCNTSSRNQVRVNAKFDAAMKEAEATKKTSGSAPANVEVAAVNQEAAINAVLFGRFNNNQK